MEDCVRIKRPDFFDINQIFDCGQCFRFDFDNTDKKTRFSGVAYGKYISVLQTDDELIFYGTTREEFDTVWKSYFALDRDYGEVRKDVLCCFKDDETIKKALEYGSGIRILRQEPWETICSFIISQNNNIPRIKKIISSMSEAFGDKITYEGREYYAFPAAKALYDAGEEKIFSLKTGFRAKYIFDAARMVAEGELDLEKLALLNTDELIFELMKVKGIGLKVASCVALFGFGKTDAFPVDVWMKRVIEKYYPNGLDIPSLGRYAGVAQQYLFYYERYNKQQ